MSDENARTTQTQPETPVDAHASNRPLAVLYLRTASGRQSDRDLAIVAQQHLCQWRAHELGAVVMAEFVDFGSGLSAERPGLTELVAKLRELRATGDRRRIYVIAADHARIARSVEAYSRVSWEIDRVGGVVNIASIPLVAYAAISSLALSDEIYRRATERDQAVREAVTRRRKGQQRKDQED